MKKLGWFAFFLIFFASCLDDPDCYQLHNAIVGVTFRVMGTGKGDSVVVLNVATKKFEQKPTFNYQLNYFVEEATIGFEGIDKTNFLKFGYAVKNQFISEDCGSAFVLSGLNILEHDFDSARVVNSTPSKGGGTNFEIYRCPETDIMTIDFNQLRANSDGVIINNKASSYVSHQFESITDSLGTNVFFKGRGTTINLPVDTAKNKGYFIFKTITATDTLEVAYNRVVEERYRPCGIQTFVSELSIKRHTFDSISFGLNANEEPARTLEDPHIANLRIFDCPKTNLMQVNFKSTTGAATSVEIKSITADHLVGNFLKDTTTTTVTLPVDLLADVSRFYIKYEDDTIDTLRVEYTRTELTLFNACPDQVINNLREVPDVDNIAISTNGAVLKYPTVPNVDITVN